LTNSAFATADDSWDHYYTFILKCHRTKEKYSYASCGKYALVVYTSGQWRRQLWGTCPPRLSAILVHFGVNQIAIQVLCSLRDQLMQMSTTHSSFYQYCISHKTISHQAAAAPDPEVRHACPMTYFPALPLLTKKPDDAIATGSRL